jgi:hypothetical protein
MDDGTVDRLLDGRIPPDDAPPGFARVAELVQIARGFPTPGEVPPAPRARGDRERTALRRAWRPVIVWIVTLQALMGVASLASAAAPTLVPRDLVPSQGPEPEPIVRATVDLARQRPAAAVTVPAGDVVSESAPAAPDALAGELIGEQAAPTSEPAPCAAGSAGTCNATTVADRSVATAVQQPPPPPAVQPAPAIEVDEPAGAQPVPAAVSGHADHDDGRPEASYDTDGDEGEDSGASEDIGDGHEDDDEEGDHSEDDDSDHDDSDDGNGHPDAADADDHGAGGDDEGSDGHDEQPDETERPWDATASGGEAAPTDESGPAGQDEG